VRDAEVGRVKFMGKGALGVIELFLFPGSSLSPFIFSFH
jgi:hypothetical protein